MSLLSSMAKVTAALPAQPCYHTLLRASKALAAFRTTRELWHQLANHLHAIVAFDCLWLLRRDPGADVLRLTILEPKNAPPPPFPVMPLAASGPVVRVWRSQTPAVVPIPSE